MSLLLLSLPTQSGIAKTEIGIVSYMIKQHSLLLKGSTSSFLKTIRGLTGKSIGFQYNSNGTPDL